MVNGYETAMLPRDIYMTDGPLTLLRNLSEPDGEFVRNDKLDSRISDSCRCLYGDPVIVTTQSS